MITGSKPASYTSRAAISIARYYHQPGDPNSGRRHDAPHFKRLDSFRGALLLSALPTSVQGDCKPCRLLIDEDAILG